MDDDSHPQVRFVVPSDRGEALPYGVQQSPQEVAFATLQDATMEAFLLARTHGKAVIKIAVSGEEGAAWLDGPPGVWHYRKDPNALFYGIYEIRVNYRGRS